MFLSFIVVLAILAVVAAKEWHLVSETKVGILVGVGGATGKAAAAAGDNNVGGEVELYDGSSWTTSTVGTGLTLDAAMTESGTAIITSLGAVLLTDGETLTKVEGVFGTSQSANIAADGAYALVGGFVGNKQSVNGVAHSVDGVTWNFYDTGMGISSRYGAFPSANTWYVSAGMWGEDPATRAKGDKEMKLSERITVTMDGFKMHAPKAPKRLGETGWTAGIAKTTDGGKTWTTVFSSNTETDYYYFNGIACSNEMHCTAVAEGYDAEGKSAIFAYTTFDGGNNWELTLQENKLSLTAVDWVNDMEGWLGGTDYGSHAGAIAGQFYKTVDGGKTWNLEQTVDNCSVIDMDIAVDGIGYAACISSSGSSCAVAMYD